MAAVASRVARDPQITVAPAGSNYYLFGRSDATLCNESPALWTSGGANEDPNRDGGGMPALP